MSRALPTDLIAEAITLAFGKRCPDYDAGCRCCRAWRQYDDIAFVVEIANRNEQSPEGDRLAAVFTSGRRE